MLVVGLRATVQSPGAIDVRESTCPSDAKLANAPPRTREEEQQTPLLLFQRRKSIFVQNDSLAAVRICANPDQEFGVDIHDARPGRKADLGDIPSIATNANPDHRGCRLRGGNPKPNHPVYVGNEPIIARLALSPLRLVEHEFERASTLCVAFVFQSLRQQSSPIRSGNGALLQLGQHDPALVAPEIDMFNERFIRLSGHNAVCGRAEQCLAPKRLLVERRGRLAHIHLRAPKYAKPLHLACAKTKVEERNWESLRTEPWQLIWQSGKQRGAVARTSDEIRNE